jgi:hypothetical protein
MPLPFRGPHHVLRPRDCCRTITQILLIRVPPEPVHATLSDTEISTITHLARVPGKELPQEAPSNPVPICPPPALADLHHAHPHPGLTVRQHSPHVEIPPVPRGAIISGIRRISQSRGESLTLDHRSPLVDAKSPPSCPGSFLLKVSGLSRTRHARSARKMRMLNFPAIGAAPSRLLRRKLKDEAFGHSFVCVEQRLRGEPTRLRSVPERQPVSFICSIV